MSELTVEAVDSLEAEELPSGVDAPEYVLYGGKGGVGKTTCAAATALASARGGTPTLVVSTDPAHSLSDTLGTEIPSEPAMIGGEDEPLFAVEIDPEAAEGPFTPEETDGDGGDIPDAGLGELFGEGSGPLGGAMPGADEAAAMQLLVEYLDDPRFERVVVDTAPTGHTLRLLELPELMDSMLGRLFSMRESLSGMVGAANPFGDDADAGTAGLDELSTRIERLRDALEDPSRTDFRVVMVPEEMSVTESERLVKRLGEFGIPVRTVVVNRVSEDLASVADLDTDWFVAPDTESCAFCRRRWEVQRDALARAQELFRGRDVKRVPLFAEAVRGEAMLAVVGRCLE